MTNRSGHRYIWIWSLIIIIDVVLVMLSGSTYDSGDSIVHYLYARQALEYPGYLLHHWAKPVFVLLSSPFTVFGWAGMKLFNSLCVLGSVFLTYRLFQTYRIRGYMAILLSFAAPHLFLVQASGLTEPLFMLFLIAVVYLIRTEQYVPAMILLSFLPFVRSEGWVIMPIVTVYLLWTGRLKAIPWIATGTVIYGIIGLFYYNDFLWMFHQNPYTGAEEKYGSGSWLHFVNQLPYVIGYPLYFLFFIGLFDGASRAMRGLMDRFELVMIYGITLGYMFAHSAFWALGIFHSFGLKRVLIVLIPLYAFIAYRGFDRLVCAFGFVKPAVVQGVLIILLAVFPFTGNNAGLGLPESVQQEPLQQLLDEVHTYTDSAYGDRMIYFGNWYIPMKYHKNIDDPQEAMTIDHLKQERARPGSLVIWDSYFSVTDKEVSSAFLQSKDELRLVRRFECQNCRNPYIVEVYLAE